VGGTEIGQKLFELGGAYYGLTSFRYVLEAWTRFMRLKTLENRSDL